MAGAYRGDPERDGDAFNQAMIKYPEYNVFCSFFFQGAEVVEVQKLEQL